MSQINNKILLIKQPMVSYENQYIEIVRRRRQTLNLKIRILPQNFNYEEEVAVF